MSPVDTQSDSQVVDHLVAAALLTVTVYIYCFPVHYKTIRPFPPLSLSLFPCCLLPPLLRVLLVLLVLMLHPDTMEVSWRRVQESFIFYYFFCQPVCASMCAEHRQKQAETLRGENASCESWRCYS